MSIHNDNNSNADSAPKQKRIRRIIVSSSASTTGESKSCNICSKSWLIPTAESGAAERKRALTAFSAHQSRHKKNSTAVNSAASAAALLVFNQSNNNNKHHNNESGAININAAAVLSTPTVSESTPTINEISTNNNPVLSINNNIETTATLTAESRSTLSAAVAIEYQIKQYHNSILTASQLLINSLKQQLQQQQSENELLKQRQSDSLVEINQLKQQLTEINELKSQEQKSAPLTAVESDLQLNSLLPVCIDINDGKHYQLVRVVGDGSCMIVSLMLQEPKYYSLLQERRKRNADYNQKPPNKKRRTADTEIIQSALCPEKSATELELHQQYKHLLYDRLLADKKLMEDNGIRFPGQDERNKWNDRDSFWRELVINPAAWGLVVLLKVVGRLSGRPVMVWNICANTDYKSNNPSNPINIEPQSVLSCIDPDPAYTASDLSNIYGAEDGLKLQAIAKMPYRLVYHQQHYNILLPLAID